MIRYEISTLIGARLGASLHLNVHTGPQHLGDLDLDFLHGDVQVTRVQGGFLVQGRLESQLSLECVRCLESFVFPVILELEETYRLSNAAAKAGVVYTVGDDGWIDLAPLVREQAWITIPMKPLCSPDCRGLCPRCGANLNLEECDCKRGEVDPRLAALQNLIK